ncbi:hypothetical protein [Micromonospora sp. NPDC023814]
MNINAIAEALGLDRKTVRSYAATLKPKPLTTCSATAAAAAPDEPCTLT